MKFQTHIIGGITLGLCASSYFDYPLMDTSIYYSALILGSLLPDIDHPKSFLGKKVKPISKSLYKWFGHRTLTHSLFIFIISFEACRLTNYHPLATGLTLGLISHILLDLLTPQGVALCYPISKKRYKCIFK